MVIVGLALYQHFCAAAHMFYHVDQMTTHWNTAISAWCCQQSSNWSSIINSNSHQHFEHFQSASTLKLFTKYDNDGRIIAWSGSSWLSHSILISSVLVGLKQDSSSLQGFIYVRRECDSSENVIQESARYNLENTVRRHNVGLMLGQRHRRWANIK